MNGVESRHGGYVVLGTGVEYIEINLWRTDEGHTSLLVRKEEDTS